MMEVISLADYLLAQQRDDKILKTFTMPLYNQGTMLKTKKSHN